MSWLATVSRNGQSPSTVPRSGALVMLTEPHSPAAEAYRSLAANLQFAYSDRQLQTIGITSSAAGEGKSTTVANLAIALAQTGRRLIIIDADLRRPGQHTLFGLDREEGLANVLKHSAATEATVTIGATDSWLSVAVSDDGHGFDQDAVRESGLRGLRDRIEALGGRVEIESRESGTRLAAALPTANGSHD